MKRTPVERPSAGELFPIEMHCKGGGKVRRRATFGETGEKEGPGKVPLGERGVGKNPDFEGIKSYLKGVGGFWSREAPEEKKSGDHTRKNKAKKGPEHDQEIQKES